MNLMNACSSSGGLIIRFYLVVTKQRPTKISFYFDADFLSNSKQIYRPPSSVIKQISPKQKMLKVMKNIIYIYIYIPPTLYNPSMFS